MARLHVPSKYETIQLAANSAKPGDFIIVSDSYKGKESIGLSIDNLTVDVPAGVLGIHITAYASVRTLSLAGKSPIQILAVGNNVSITGNSGDNYIFEMSDNSNDYLNGGDGNDTLVSNNGIDTLIGGNGDDKFYFDFYRGAAGGMIDGGTGIDTLTARDLKDYKIYNVEKLIIDDGFADGMSLFGSISQISSFESIMLSPDKAGAIASINLNGEGGKLDIGRKVNTSQALNINASALKSGIEIKSGAKSDSIVGTKYGDTLDGSIGADTLSGESGHDTYLVDHASDRVVELVGAGRDTVITTVSYKLAAGQEIETLQFAKTVGTAALNLLGNEFANTLVGSAGNNVLDGGGGVDAMYGGTGSDTYVVDHANDKVSEAKGAGTDTVLSSVSYALKAGQEIEALQLLASTSTARLDLTGNEFDQKLVGNAGANTLNGGLGNDALTGGRGADTFVFSTASGANNVDRITDFAVEDTIRLSKSVFAALAPGQLAANEFKDIGRAKLDADDHIIYDSRNGSLFYDADGSGKAAAVKFAVLDNKAALTHADFLVA